MKWVKRILGHCGQCGRFFVYPKRRRMHTFYADEESNYCCVCRECFEAIEEYWDERWNEYYSSVL